MGATDYGTRVWQGDNTTVAEARKRYENNPYGGLIPFATALYSFRQEKQYADELIGLKDELMELADRDMHVQVLPSDEEFSRKMADRADTVSTHLEWISRQVNHPLLFDRYFQ